MLEQFDRHALYVKIYGERNSGTNFLERLINQNFSVEFLQSNNNIYKYVKEVEKRLPENERGRFRSEMLDFDCRRMRVSELGWKHGCAVLDDIARAPHAPHTLFVCVTKHPVFWLKSLVRRPYNPIETPPKNFSAFIRHAWTMTDRDNIPDTLRMNVVDLWNHKTKSYLELNKIAKRVVIQRYEAALTDPKLFLDMCSSHLIGKEEKYFWNLASTKKDDADFEAYRVKYDLAKVKDACSPKDFDFIMDRIDPDILEAIGYSE